MSRHLLGTGTKYINRQTLEIAGAATWSAGHIGGGNGSVIRTLPGGVFDAQVNSYSYYNAYLPGDALFDNQGTLERTGTLGIGIIGARLTSSGHVGVSGTVLALNRGGIMRGTASVAAGTTLQVGGDSMVVDSGLGVSGPGALVVSGGVLDVRGNILDVAGDFATSSTGALRMSNGDNVTVGGNATFSGGTTVGRLTSGTLRVRSNFSQSTGSTSFHATGSHVTILDGSGSQTVSFTHPNTAFGSSNSQFANLSIGNTAGAVALLSNIAAAGQLQTADTVSARTVLGTGQTVYAQGLRAAQLTMDSVTLDVSAGAAIQVFNRVTFKRQDPTRIQFSLTRPTGSFTFDGLVFPISQPTTGAYLRVFNNSTVQTSLGVTLANATPFDPGTGKVVVGSTAGGDPTVFWNSFCFGVCLL